MNKTNQVYTLITGSSQGLGKAFAEICAKNGRNLILISLPDENNGNLSKELAGKYEIKAIRYEVDLTKKEDLYKLVDFVKGYRIDMLINNAGIGGTTRFEDTSLDFLNEIILLNIKSLVTLTHQLLPVLKQEEEAYILNISSLAAFAPMPFKTVYSASKAFVYSFSRGLKSELEDSNIHVAVAHPGPMPTNENVTKRVNALTGMVKYSVLTPEETAKICLEKLLKKKAVIIPGKFNWFNSLLLRFVPVPLQLKILNGKLKTEAAKTHSYD
ncbi:SDR family NAD(P)-dependent oxidoreductase [Salegentibacter sp. JZCK2]|uniref:SDR family NAD(P)-dependent oxidoreductase n=1 Tax=Salegentibacter tibetensis TaxID=2873600 RepID=UPI001CCAF57D|nr:SDR family NAD(P)-dependent oxidoreductase [Salegentibacter tibetensis]MBZ9728112.1 SDR family NAD(P)-dependent oxidoreductase [Salegentibacter tibetensis]